MATLVVLYAMHYDSALLSRLPFMNHAAERGLSQLPALRDPRTRLAIVTPEPVAPEVLDYYLRDVAGFRDEELPGVAARLFLVQPRADIPDALDTMTLADAGLLGQLRDLVAGDPAARLVNFAASPENDAIAEALGVPAEQRPAALSATLGGKGAGKRILRQAGVPTSPGTCDLLHAPADVVTACRAWDGGDRLLALKLEDGKWGAGVGTVLLDRAVVARTGEVPAGIVKAAQSWCDIAEDMARGGAILEVFHEGVIGSPSGQAVIADDGRVRAVSTHEQILDGDRYVGCVHPVRPDVDAVMRAHLLAVGRVLSDRGVRGTFGVDFVTLPDGDLVATEINLRKVGPSHVTAHVDDAVGLDQVHFVHRRVHEPAALAGTSPSRVISTLRAHGLLFDHALGAGVLLHMLGAVRECGYLETTSVAATGEEAAELDRRARSVLGLAPAESVAVRTPGPVG